MLNTYRLSVFYFLAFLIITNTIAAQTINKSLQSNIYEFEGQLYKYNDLGKILSQNPQALQQFDRYGRKGQASIKLGVAALGSAGLGLLLLSSDTTSDGVLVSGQIIWGGMLVVAAVPLGVLSLAALGSRAKAKRKSIELFNQTIGLEEPQETVHSWKVEFISNNNGFGLSLIF